VYIPHTNCEVIKMARTSSIMWDMFTGTGNIDIYLKYKRHEAKKDTDDNGGVRSIQGKREFKGRLV